LGQDSFFLKKNADEGNKSALVVSYSGFWIKNIFNYKQ